MLYFTGEVFRRLANQNRGHVRVMLEYMYFTGEVFRRLANQNRGHIRVMLEQT